ncbi:MAG: NAD+ synthase [Nitrososphaeria archaeon]|nr:NAD+ synthase [Nitrososphaeria archaeon]
MKFAIAQINVTVGDLEGNTKKIQDYLKKAVDVEADIVIFPELTITGYPPQDLLFEKSFVKENREKLLELVERSGDVVGIVGYVESVGERLYNSAAVFQNRTILAKIYKTLLPTYDVFDEARYFTGQDVNDIRPVRVNVRGKSINLGVEICEDLWDERYDIKVTEILVKRGADYIINISASPYYVAKKFERFKLLKEKARQYHVPIFYANLVGAQDELVFDGQSMVVSDEGNLIAFGKQFEEDLVLVDESEFGQKNVQLPPYVFEEEVFNALVLGVRDYFRKAGFEKAVVGISGGIDSSLTTCIAVEALGKENVIGVLMPSKYSSEASRIDARNLAENLGICYVEIPIQEIVDCYRNVMAPYLEKIRNHYSVKVEDDDPVADENIQARVRGNILMDISNRLKKLKILVLNTGDKTEVALGYCTIYGDMVGMLDVLGDISKLECYRLAEYYNRKSGKQVVPENVFRKKPSPELKEGQIAPFDYSIVSPLVDEIIENRISKEELIEKGYPKDIVYEVYSRIRSSEYKRWQAAPCIKIHKKAFGLGWRMPIINKYDC